MKVKICDWDIGISRQYAYIYIGSKRPWLDNNIQFGQDLFIVFLGFMLYIAVSWR